MRHLIITSLCLSLFIGAAVAQETPPFEINMDRVQVVHAGSFADSKTYFIPTIYLHVEARNTSWAKNEGAEAKARIFVEGLEKPRPQVTEKKGGSIWGKSVDIDFTPGLMLYSASVNGLPPNLGWCSIQIQQHGKRLAADNAGTIRKQSESKTETGLWSRTTGDFVFTLDPAAFSTGILRVGYAINDLTVATIKKANH